MNKLYPNCFRHISAIPPLGGKCGKLIEITENAILSGF
jgi:hypothetical protein